MIGTAERNSVREEQNYNGYSSTYSGRAPVAERSYYYNNSRYEAPAAETPTEEYRDYLWGKLNSTAGTVPAYQRQARASAQTSSEAYSRSAIRPVFQPVDYSSLKPASRRKTSKKLSTQGKIILAVYLVVVLVIVSLVIINAEMINGSTDTYTKVEAVSPFEANENGLRYIESPSSQTIKTNAFDNFCDGINRLLGE